MTPITRREFVKGSATLPLALSTLTTRARTAMPSESFDVVVAGAGHEDLDVGGTVAPVVVPADDYVAERYGISPLRRAEP